MVVGVAVRLEAGARVGASRLACVLYEDADNPRRKVNSEVLESGSADGAPLTQLFTNESAAGASSRLAGMAMQMVMPEFVGEENWFDVQEVRGHGRHSL